MWVFWSSVSKFSYSGNHRFNCSSTCCQAGEIGNVNAVFLPWPPTCQAAGRYGLLGDLGASMATCCPFYTKAACASQQERALTSAGRSKQSPGGSEAPWQSGLVWRTQNSCDWHEQPGLHVLSPLPGAPAWWPHKSLCPAPMLAQPDTPGSAGCSYREQRLKSLFQINWFYDFSLNAFVILINLKIQVMNAGSNRKRSCKMSVKLEVK